MTLPTLPASTDQEKLADSARELQKQLEAARESMRGMSATDLPAVLAALAKVVQGADQAGPELQKLFADPKMAAAARSLRRQFADVWDAAVQMAGVAKEKADEASRAAAEAAKKEKERGEAAHEKATEAGGDKGNAIADTIGGAMTGGASAVAGLVQSAVQAGSPGTSDRFERSQQDLSAVFGQAIAPLIDLATQVMDEVNGVLGELKPVLTEIVSDIVSDLQPVIESLVTLAASLAEAFKEIWEAIGPTFNSVMEELAAAVIVVVKAIQYLIDILMALGKQGPVKDFGQAQQEVDAANAEKKALEQKAADAKKAADAHPGDAKLAAAAEAAAAKARGKDPAADKTFAAKPAEFGGLEDLGRKQAQAFASLGTAGPKSTEDNTKDIADRVEAMQAALAGFASLFALGMNGAAGLYDFFVKGVGKVGEAAKQAVSAGVSMSNFQASDLWSWLEAGVPTK